MTDPHQLCLGWLGSRPHTSNRVLVTAVTRGAVGLAKSSEGERGESDEGERGEWWQRLRQEKEQGGGGDSAGVVELSSEEPNMSPEELCV
jgi:hypothetical protein